MNWFLLSIIPPFLWAINNHIDKHLVGRGVGSVMIFSALIGLPVALIILYLNPSVLIFSKTIPLIILSGFIYVLATLPYFHALAEEETSLIVPLFQFIPLMTYIAEYFVLGETLTIRQTLGGVLIIAGGVLIQLKRDEFKSIKFNGRVFGLMFLSSLLFTTSFFMFKLFSKAGLGTLTFSQVAF